MLDFLDVIFQENLIMVDTDFEEFLKRQLLYQCDVCWDSTLWIRNGELAICEACDTRPDINAAARQLCEVVFQRTVKNQPINQQAFLAARALIKSTVANPVPLQILMILSGTSDRATKGLIEVLRSEWLLPVGASKNSPSGYYWIRTAQEMKDWLTAFLAQPKSEFHTAHRMVNANFPELAGQLRLDYEAEGESDGTN